MTTENEGLEALDRIESIVTEPIIDEALNLGAVCGKYKKIKPLLTTALTFIGMIPVYGSKIAVAVRFLMSVADTACKT